MAIQVLRGFRDFYPENQAKINFLRSKIAATCALFGYEEFEAPVVESFELYAAKSSDEIVNEQAFTFEDKGGEKIALRPELTPSLARMVAAKQNELAFPLRWWSWGRFWRYERPQKGRGREFYQWNCDLLGDDSINAEIEILEIAITFLQSLGLTAKDVVIEINDRAFVTELLVKNSIDAAKSGDVFKFLDKLPKLQSEKQREYGKELGFTDTEIETILTTFTKSDAWKESATLTTIMETVTAKGLEDWVMPNLTIVRGLLYYTGLVFEVSDRAKEFRAMLGGGRYGNLVETVGGKPVSGIGFGAGDMVLQLYLDSKGLLPDYKTTAQICVIGLGQETTVYCQEVCSQLRANNIATLFYGTPDSFGKGLKFVSTKKIPFALLIGTDEVANRSVTLKNLQTGEQQSILITQVAHTIATTA